MTCTNGQSCIANSWTQGGYVCGCPPGTSGTGCATGVLGTNFYQVTDSNSFTTSQYDWFGTPAIINPPFSKIDWTVAVVVIPVVTTPDPGQLLLTITSPAGYGPILSLASIYNLAGCSSENGIPYYDNATIAWGPSSATSVCSATKLGGYGLGYYNPSGVFTCFTSGCSLSSDTGTFTAYPFATSLQMGGGAAAETWLFEVLDNNSGSSSSSRSTINSWTLQFYRT